MRHFISALLVLLVAACLANAAGVCNKPHMTKARCERLEQCRWAAAAQKCRVKQAATPSPTHATQTPTASPTVVYPCSFFKQKIGCCGAKYAAGTSTACLNEHVNPPNSCRWNAKAKVCLG